MEFTLAKGTGIGGNVGLANLLTDSNLSKFTLMMYSVFVKKIAKRQKKNAKN